MHTGGGFFLFVDDHVEFLSDNTDPKMLEELIKLAPN